MNSNIVKPEKFDHLHLVYNFTVPLIHICKTLNLHSLNTPLYLSGDGIFQNGFIGVMEKRHRNDIS